MRVYRPLVQLVAVADQIIEILDRNPHAGIAALVEVPGLDHDERYRIGALMPKVVEQMAQFETTVDAAASPVVAEPEPAAAGAPVEFTASGRNQTAYRAVSIASGVLELVSPVALQPSWLTELTLHCPPSPITMLFHIVSCRATAGREFQVIAQPFGLAGDDERAWQGLVARAERAQPPGP
jgi:hypothetical protein